MRLITTLTSIILLLSLTAALAAAAPVAGRVVALQGQVTAEAGGAKRVLALRGDVFEGDVIATAANGRAQIMFRDRTMFTLGPNSRLGITEYLRTAAGRAEFQLQQGNIRMVSGQIVRNNPDNFRMNTPVACIGVRGTMTGHEVTPSGERHYVLDIADGHEVIIFGQDNPNDFRVLTGDFTAVDVAADGSVSDVRPMSSDELAAFNDATTVGTDNPLTADAAAATDNSSEDGSTTTTADGTTTATEGAATGDGSTGGTTVLADVTTTTTSTGDATTTTSSFTADATADQTAATTGSTTGGTAGTTAPASLYTHNVGSVLLIGTDGRPATAYRGDVAAISSAQSYTQVGSGGAIATSVSGNNPTVGSVSYYQSPDLYTWSGAQAATYTAAGTYGGATPYMEWGAWDLNNPAARFYVTGGASPGDVALSRGYVVTGQLTPSADLASLRAGNVQATYTGNASGVYYLNTTPAQNISGTFSTQIDFGTDQISNMNLNFTAPGITMGTTGFAGILNADGTFSVTSPLVITSPGAGTHSGSVTGATFGANAAAVGGTWEMSTVGTDVEGATGEFHGIR